MRVQARRKRTAFEFAAVFLALLAGCVLGELVVRATNVDWRILKKNLTRWDQYRESHLADPDPALLNRLKPDSHVDTYGRLGWHRVDVNSQGARGPERSAAKAASVYRILCLGGSTVFGADVRDDQAWPARLEDLLNARGCGKFEVWNFGVCGHKMGQSVRLARQVLGLQPDLLIFSLSNLGEPMFLNGDLVRSYFEKNPDLWRQYLPAWQSTRLHFVPDSLFACVYGHFRLVRFAVMAGASFSRKFLESVGTWKPDLDEFERRNSAELRDFVAAYREKFKILIFVGPYACTAEQRRKNETSVKAQAYCYIYIDEQGKYLTGVGAPVYHLSGENAPPEFTEIHPSPRVLAWYAENLADYLAKNQLLPACDRGPQ